MTSRCRILAPVDMSRRSDEAVQHAKALANVLSANLDVLHVVDPQHSNGERASVRPKDTWRALNCNLDVGRQVLEGPTAPTIAAYAEAVDADVVMLQSRSYRRWNLFGRRSVTKDLMQLTHRPVCITSAQGTDADFAFRHRRILCVLGLDGRETALLEHAQELAGKCGAELVLLHVVPETSEALLHHAVGNGVRPLSTQRATEELRDIVRALRMPATMSVVVGSPGKCIALAAREHSVDLVLVSRAHAGTDSTYDNDLDDVLSRLRCPLLTVSVDAPLSPRLVTDLRTSPSKHSPVSAPLPALIGDHECAAGC
jgi:nucleotide-binding universal stress UspA family protein